MSSESSNGSQNASSSKKLLENPIIGSMVVPVAILLVAAAIIFGVTRMLSSQRSYKDLVVELKSKTFGNRWVAAFELSKVISRSAVPEEDIPWLIESLSELYDSAKDSRTRNYAIVAMKALRNPLAYEHIAKGLKDEDINVRFHSIAAIADMPKNKISVEQLKVLEPFLTSKDSAEQHASILALASHKAFFAAPHFKDFLSSDNVSIKYAAATALVSFRDSQTLPIIKEIFELEPVDKKKSTEPGFDLIQVRNLKANVLATLKKEQWGDALPLVDNLVKNERDEKILGMAMEVAKLLKN